LMFTKAFAVKPVPVNVMVSPRLYFGLSVLMVAVAAAPWNDDTKRRVIVKLRVRSAKFFFDFNQIFGFITFPLNQLIEFSIPLSPARHTWEQIFLAMRNRVRRPCKKIRGTTAEDSFNDLYRQGRMVSHQRKSDGRALIRSTLVLRANKSTLKS